MSHFGFGPAISAGFFAGISRRPAHTTLRFPLALSSIASSMNQYSFAISSRLLELLSGSFESCSIAFIWLSFSNPEYSLLNSLNSFSDFIDALRFSTSSFVTNPPFSFRAFIASEIPSSSPHCPCVVFSISASLWDFFVNSGSNSLYHLYPFCNSAIVVLLPSSRVISVFKSIPALLPVGC